MGLQFLTGVPSVSEGQYLCEFVEIRHLKNAVRRI